MQINKACRDSFVDDDGNVKNTVGACRGSLDPNTIDFGRSYALGNINNMIKDYEITYGMVPGQDYEIVAVVHSGGGSLLLKDESYDGSGNFLTGRNKFEQEVMNLMDRGVKFYFCQNTTRGFIRNGTLPAGNATAQLIPGVLYTTAGVTAIAEFQQRGYEYVQP
jgi:intracellular sulfur oxidation DsrE/DsrF family protein